SLVLSSVEQHFAEQDADELIVITQAVVEVLQATDNPLHQPDVLSGAVSGHHGVYFQVWDRHGQLVFGSTGANFAVVTEELSPVKQIQADNLATWEAHGNSYRGVVTQVLIGGKEYRIVTAM